MKPKTSNDLTAWSQELEDQWNAADVLIKRDQVLGWRGKPIYNPRLCATQDENLIAWGRSELSKRDDQ